MNDRRIYLIINDKLLHQQLADGLRRPEVRIIDCATAEAFLSLVDDAHPTCVVTTAALPGMSGLELLEALRRRLMRLPVAVITSLGSVPVAVEAMRLGAAEVVEAPIDPLRATRQILALLEADVQAAQRRRDLRQVRHGLQALSEGERSVLAKLLDGNPHKIIAADLGVSERTVESRRARIFTKLGANSVAHLVRDVLLLGDPALLPDSSFGWPRR